MITRKKKELVDFIFVKSWWIDYKKKKELVDFIFVKIWWLTLKRNKKGWWIWKYDIYSPSGLFYISTSCFLFAYISNSIF